MQVLLLHAEEGYSHMLRTKDTPLLYFCIHVPTDQHAVPTVTHLSSCNTDMLLCLMLLLMRAGTVEALTQVRKP